MFPASDGICGKVLENELVLRGEVMGEPDDGLDIILNKAPPGPGHSEGQNPFRQFRQEIITVSRS